MKKRKVYRGWIVPGPYFIRKGGALELSLFKTEISPLFRPCKITVEWTEAKRKAK